MSPAKATRPGFRQSVPMSPEGQNADQAAMNLFHPIYHSYTFPTGCRIDIERLLPAKLAELDDEELIDNFSEPPAWVEHIAPLGVQVGDQVFRGRNAQEMMLRVYRLMFDLFSAIGRFISTTAGQNAEERPFHLPFLSLAVDPDTMHKLIEMDYETGETGYVNLMKLFSKGTVSPCITTPFHAILPMLPGEAEIRLCVKSAFIFYSRVLDQYAAYLKKHFEDDLLVLPVWLPESGYSELTQRVIEEEFAVFCKQHKLKGAHLVLMLDNHQAANSENDVMMKSWNQTAPKLENGSRSSKRNGAGEGNSNVSVLFRDRSFSDWVIHAKPSVKKLLDRTIAKVDSDINSQNVHYGWAHFEELEAVTYSPRSILNFQQKLVKLTELGYLPISPDFYVRGKLRGEFGCARHEPQMVDMVDNSAGNGWNLENSRDLGRWMGHDTAAENGEGKLKIVTQSYERQLEEGTDKRRGSQSWKIAWNGVWRKIYDEVVGDLSTGKGGMAKVLSGMTAQRGVEKSANNVQEFLAHYTYVYWREHFIQHDMAEADINIIEVSNKYLRAGSKTELDEEHCAIAGAAGQAIYFALDSARSTGLAWENMDNRAFYQNVAMLTLAIVNAMHVYHWTGEAKKARKLLDLMQTELFDFPGAYDRYELQSKGVTKTEWREAIKSEIDESRDNVVKRAALRVAARHLRPLGYGKDFTRADANTTTNVGHIWSLESNRENLAYENMLYCGVSEE